MTCPVSHLLGSECRDDPLLQERAQAPVDVSALTSNAPVPFRMPWSHRRHTVPQEVRRAFDPEEIAPLQGKPRFRSPSTPGRITSYENPSSRLRQLNEARNSHVVVDELKKERTVMVLFDAANAYEFRIFPVERFCALFLSRRGILILENWQERLPA